MDVLGEEILKIWGILPVFPAIIVFASAILVRIQNQETDSPINEIRDKKNNYKIEKIFSNVNNVLGIYLIIGTLLFVLPLMVILNDIYESYVYEMINKIEVISSIVIGMTGITITVVVLIVTFDKTYYIVFSVREVLQKYRFSECLNVMILSFVLVSGMTMTLLNNKIDTLFDYVRLIVLEIGTLYNFISVAYLLYVLSKTVFLDKKSDLSLLRQLYRFFWLHRVDTSHFKDKEMWSRDAIDINAEFLIEDFINICRKRAIMQIEDIEFATTIGCYKQKWYGKVRCKFIRRMALFFTVSVLVNLWELNEQSSILIACIALITIITIIPTFLNIESIQLVIMRLHSDTWGYYVRKRNGKEVFIPRVAIRIDNVYDKYIMKMNSINAFFYILIKYKDNDRAIIQNLYEDILLRFEDIKVKSMATLFPVFTIGYFLFDNDLKIDSVKGLYREVVISESRRNRFCRMMHSQIFYLIQEQNKDFFKYREKLNAYLKWLES